MPSFPLSLFIPLFLIALTALFFLRPRTLRIKTLKLLGQGPKSAEEICAHLELSAQDALILLHFMEHSSEELKREWRAPWDDQGNRRPPEVFRITPKGIRQLKTVLDRERAISHG